MSKVLDILHELFANTSEENEHILFVQADVYRKIKKTIKIEMKDGGVSYTSFKDAEVALSSKNRPVVDSFSWLGKTFHIGCIERNLEFLAGKDKVIDPYENEEEREE